MAFIVLYKNKLIKNFEYLSNLFSEKGISWSVVTKMLCGNELFLNELLQLGVKQVCDSHIYNLRVIKELDPNIETIYIKPPPHRLIEKIITYADISMNSDFITITKLSKEAEKQNKTHKIIIMLELGELREGVMSEDLVRFYEKVFYLPGIKVIGLGTNLSCMNGVLPNKEKLIQLCIYKQLIEARFNNQLDLVSGGSSVTIPLIFKNLLPKGVNHFRVGESLFLGTDVYNDGLLPNMEIDVFKLFAEIIELIEKPMLPFGDIGTNLEGEVVKHDPALEGMVRLRAIVDLGILDVEHKNISPADRKLKIIGVSSDMMVIDIEDRKNDYKVGDLIEFKMNYMGALRLINSRYVEKMVK